MRNSKKRGSNVVIVFEGMPASGKTTQIALLKEYFKNMWKMMSGKMVGKMVSVLVFKFFSENQS